MMNSEPDIKTGLNCYNCNEVVNLDNKFCPNCGQANHPTKLTIGILFRDFIDNFFNLDSKFFKTLFHIYSPTYLTQEYIAGRRVKYANPIRLFFMSIVVLFALLTFYLDGVIEFDKIGNVTDKMTSDTTRSGLLEKLDTYIDTTDWNANQIVMADSIRKHLFKNINHLDSTYLNLSNFISFDEKKDYKFLTTDVLNMDPDSVLVKYEITDFKEKVFIKQSLKSYLNGGDTIKYLISNGLWVFVLTILLSGFVLKLLHIRHKIFYIEHIILLCNIHSFFFILMIVSITVTLWWPPGSTIIISILSSYFLYILLVFKRYYKQRFLKTLFKFVIYMLSYNFVLFLCFIFVLIVSFLLF